MEIEKAMWTRVTMQPRFDDMSLQVVERFEVLLARFTSKGAGGWLKDDGCVQML